jgi:hypothetical protein
MPLRPCPDSSALPEGGASHLAQTNACSLAHCDAFRLPEGGASRLAESGDPCSLPGTGFFSTPESNPSAPPESGVYRVPESGAPGIAEGGAEGADRSSLLIPATLALLDLLPSVGP